MLFTGEYEHTIDAQQRLAIPAEVRSQLEREGEGAAFYLAPGANGHTWLWPESTFRQMAGAMEQSLLQPDELMEFEELLFTQSRRLEIDKAGRIRLPERVLTELGLGQSVVILGVKDHLELRDPAQWSEQRRQKRTRQTEIMLQARRALGQQRQDRRGRGEEDS